MKKILSVLLTASMLISALTACTTANDPLEETNYHSETESLSESETTPATDAETESVFEAETRIETNEETESVFEAETRIETNEETESETEMDDFIQGGEGERVWYSFLSIRDLHTYITTGSRNYDDYLTAPYNAPLEDFVPTEWVAPDYRALSSYFEFDESDFEYEFAAFSWDDNGRLFFSYSLDNVNVRIYPIQNTASQTVTGWMSKYLNIKISDSELNTYVPDMVANNSWILREYGENSVVYLLDEKSVKERAYMLTEDSLISIQLFYSSDADYAQILLDEKYAAFSAFFADDQQVFETAMADIGKASSEKS